MSHMVIRVIGTVAFALSLVVAPGVRADEEVIGSGVRGRAAAKASALAKRRPRPVLAEEEELFPAGPVAKLPTREARSRGYEPGQLHRQPVRKVSHDEIILEAGDDTAYYDHVPSHQSHHGGCADGSCGQGDSCSDCDACGSYSMDDWDCPSCFSMLLQRAQYSTGVHSFSGPANRGGLGSFGIHEGINFGVPILSQHGGIGMQAGVLFTQSNFNGNDFTRDDRTQLFTTVGLFRRVDWGVQFGAVVDYLHEDWYYQTDLVQLRGEISWMMPDATDIGFMFATSLNDDTVSEATFNAAQLPVASNAFFEATDTYAIFLRREFCNGGDARIFAGLSGQSDGLFGGSFGTRLQDNIAARADVFYLIPEQGKLDGGHIEESWNMSFSLIFGGGGGCGCGGRDYYRPLFNVANNGSFLVDRTPR